MSKTIVRAGAAFLALSDDGQGRRISFGTQKNGLMRDPVIVAFTKKQAKEAAARLVELSDELPDEI